MKDAPAFDFYPADFLSGTRLMTFAEKGLYIELLCLQWEDGSLPSDAMLERLGAKPADLLVVLSKFPEGEDGKRRNARLERVRDEQRKRIAKSRDKRAEYWPNAPDETTPDLTTK